MVRKTLPVSGFGASISAESDNVEIAARLLDFGYSEEGHMYYNFGNLKGRIREETAHSWFLKAVLTKQSAA